MANVKKGNLTAPPEWWKHLKWQAKHFWKGERQAHRKSIQTELDEVRKDQHDPHKTKQHLD